MSVKLMFEPGGACAFYLGSSMDTTEGKVKQVGVIAPDPLLDAFSALIQSAPHLALLAAARNAETLQARLAGRTPDSILAYLVQENGESCDAAAVETIRQLKAAWPIAACLVIVKYLAQVDPALAAGADHALVEGVSAQDLLAALGD